MTEEMKKLRDELAKSRAVQVEIKQRQNPTLSVFENGNRSFIKGFDACYKEMQARHDSNAKSWEVAKEIEIGARFKGDYDKVCEERDTLKQQLEIAMKALSIVTFLKSKVHWVAPNNRDELRTLLSKGEQALTQIKALQRSRNGSTKRSYA